MADNSKNTNPEPRGYICAVALVIAVPVVITVLYNIHLFDYDAIPSGDLLQYAGICLGLFLSARMLVFERRKEEARREEKRREERIRFRPKLAISIEEQANRYLKMTMTNIGSKTIFNLFFVEEFIAPFLLPGQECVRLLSNGKRGQSDIIDIAKYDEIICDDQTIPKEVYFHMLDEANYGWECTVTRSQNGSGYVFFCDMKPFADSD